ncbi:MAG: hypothetical protein KIS67_17375 [Verrucomicrobiae bacterium]|nr:hypothetical protein [Verrucomicrobiae bacterium]
MRFELKFERRLAHHRVQIGLHGALEYRALVIGRLPDLLEVSQPMQMGQTVTILFVTLVVVAADVMVVARIADDGLLRAQV